MNTSINTREQYEAKLAADRAAKRQQAADNTYTGLRSTRTGIAPASEAAVNMVAALTETSPFDEIWFLSGEQDYSKGFIYRMPQGGSNYTAIEIKRFGIARTSVAVITNHYSPEQEVVETKLIPRDDTLSTFLALVAQHAK